MERRILGLDPGLAILGFGEICYQTEKFLTKAPGSLEAQSLQS